MSTPRPVDPDTGVAGPLGGLVPVRFRQAELHRVVLPLVTPFRTARGVQAEREVLLVRLVGTTADGDEAEGWGEGVALAEPDYSPEHLDGMHEVVRRFLLPRLDGPLVAEDLAARFAPVKGNPMARASVEAAVLDATLRVSRRSLAGHLGAVRDRVPAGVAVGITGSVGELLDAVGAFVAQGYPRVKLKIEPGWDVEPVRAVRERFGDSLLLQVDANGSYARLGREAVAALASLDPFGLLLMEQPLRDDDLVGHADLARRIATPVCLDESIVSVDSARTAIALGACHVINLKPARVGGLLEARRIHDLCVAEGVDLWCGGMYETGIGRAANVALAALPGFTLPGDLSASDRWFDPDLTDPFVLDGGALRVPSGPGIGVVPRREVLEAHTRSVESIPLVG